MPETTCIVPECSKAGRHILPSDKIRRDAWIIAIRRGKSQFEKWSPPSKYSYVCGEHFTESDYVGLTYHGTIAEVKKLKKTAVPSRFAWNADTPLPENNKRRLRYEERSVKRRRLFVDLTNTTETVDTEEQKPCDWAIPEDNIVVGACQEVTSESNGNSTHDETSETIENNQAKEFLSSQTQTPKRPLLAVDDYRTDDEGIHYYTGLENFVRLIFVLQTLGPAAYCLNYVHNTFVSLSVPDQFFLVLIKLRRRTPNFELSRSFNIRENTVSSIFITWINFMARQWRELDIWPSKDLVKYFAPSGFRALYPNTRVIIDGTECPIKKPRNPLAQQASFSTYKNRNTSKVLVGITPGGMVSFVSDAYGGSASDRQITERSALMHLCDPNDSIMADKGFNVQDLFAPYDVSINIPTFFKKKNRMSGETVIKDRKISSKRVHVERVIGVAKTYKILVRPMHPTETKMSSDIIFVCFMLCNFRTLIVPKTA